MVEVSLIKYLSNKKLDWVQMYLVLISYGAVRADLFLENNFSEEDAKIIKEEVNKYKDLEELYDKIDRIKIQRKKRKKDNLNSMLPIEEFGPFPKEVEDALRENVIDNMDDLLTRKLKKGSVDSHIQEYLDFMKEWYDFSRFEKDGKKLTKVKKNSKI